jgi:hypothetical protein
MSDATIWRSLVGEVYSRRIFREVRKATTGWKAVQRKKGRKRGEEEQGCSVRTSLTCQICRSTPSTIR